MKNFVLTFSLLFAGLLALSPVAVHQARANATPATVTAVSTGMPPGAHEMIALRLSLSETIVTNAQEGGFLDRLGAWFNRNGCRARVILNFGRPFEIELDGHTHLVSWSDCNAMRAS